MNNLNPAQLEAVLQIDGPLLINAGAGSGKTHTVTERVVHMIHNRGIDPRSILCVTFTNKAAKEMRERIAKRLWLNPDGVNPLRSPFLPMVATFHSMSSFFLRMFIDKLGYAKDFIIYDSDDCLRTVKAIMRELSIDEKENNPRGVQAMISQTKGKGMTPEEFSLTVDSYFGSVVLDVYKQYQGKLKADNALDFDDLLLFMRRILDFEDVREYFYTRFHYFMVDEYQDTNSLQYDTIRILAQKERNLCVVGDDWQGIYSWRWADIENILSFKKDYPEAKVINLEQNYRSTQNIILAANELIKKNSKQMKKNLFTENEIGEKIVILEGIDEKHEADMITNVIRNAKEKMEDEESTGGAFSYSHYAVLYRTNGQSRLIEESLIHKNIPYQVFWGMKFYERKEVKDILAYMRLIYNPSDTISLRRIINVPGRKIGERTLELLMELLEAEHLSIFDLVDNYHFLDRFTPQAQKGIVSFLTLYGGLRKESMTSSVGELMEKLIKRSNYLEYLKEEYGEDEFEEKVDNVEEFMNMASRYDGLIYPENLSLFLEDIALITDQDREKEGEREMVSLMTVHLAKGLEFPHVIIAGAEEGVFPHSRSLLEADAIEEERRLMYVAITRAKKTLHISRAQERYNFGNYSANPKSRFLKEIPEEYLHIETNRGSARSIFWNGGDGFTSFGSILSGTSPVQGLAPTYKKTIKPKNSAWDFSLWDRIEHAQYGIGTIVAISGAVADIAFSGTGIKKMNVEIAPIKKI